MKTIEILAQAQGAFSTSDVEKFLDLYCGPPEGAELVLKKHCIQGGLQEKLDHTTEARLFAMALHWYGRGNHESGHLIRRLVRNGLDIHAPVQKSYVKWRKWNDLDGFGYGDWEICATPLDALFKLTFTPSEAASAAEAWLHLLSCEGYDVLAYLKWETREHELRQQLTFANLFMSPVWVEMVIQTEGILGASWDWRFDIRNPISTLLQEFKAFNIETGEHLAPLSHSWQAVWPYYYPKVSLAREPHQRYINDPEWGQAFELAEQRAERRMYKKIGKARGAQKCKRTSSMPGAWPM